eukprot:250946-Karenia_brevis.AAC.1
MGISRSDLTPDEANGGWLNLIVRNHTLGNADREELCVEALTYHSKISLRMSGYLRLTWENINTAEWLSGSILNMNATCARTAARQFHEHLKRLRPAQMTPYEKHCVSDDALMQQLEDFGLQEPARLLWKRNGRWEHLFKFPAPRFLGSGDT